MFLNVIKSFIHNYHSHVSCLTGKDELPQHYRERMLYLFSSAHVLSATNRFDPECEPHLDEVLNQESIHCS